MSVLVDAAVTQNSNRYKVLVNGFISGKVLYLSVESVVSVVDLSVYIRIRGNRPKPKAKVSLKYAMYFTTNSHELKTVMNINLGA